LPEILRLNHPLEAVQRVLSVLEAVEFKWTIQQVLDSPEDWLDDILTMKGAGERYKRIRGEADGSNG
jgi:hypothetical protein